jgi:predicted DNA-binding transcriptional regulator YafY
VPVQAAVVTLSTAAVEQQQVMLRHRSAQGVETERRVDPYGLVYREGRWYVVGHCHLRAGQRVFRLDRVQEVTLQDEPFTRPAEFDPLAVVLRILAQQSGA